MNCTEATDPKVRCAVENFPPLKEQGKEHMQSRKMHLRKSFPLGPLNVRARNLSVEESGEILGHYQAVNLGQCVNSKNKTVFGGFMYENQLFAI